MRISRRAMIAGAALVPAASILPAQTPAKVKESKGLAADELAILAAMVDRIVPADANGPGAIECGAVNYIDRAIAGALSDERRIFTEGLIIVEQIAQQTRGKAFAELKPEQRDEILTAMDEGRVQGYAAARGFFARVRRLTIEGMFSDPYYGGNKNYAGWDLISYPGPRLAVAPGDQSLSPTKPLRSSAYGGTQHGH
jgi:hypothetical protein